jgi:hypothetical protein
LFDSCDHHQTHRYINHQFEHTEIDYNSDVLNGDVLSTLDQSSVREHRLCGGSVKNHSKLVNGDTDRDAFIAFFCARREESVSRQQT